MRIHSSEKIKKLKELRKIGYSIPELVKKLSIPKTTVWHHIHNVKVLPAYVSVLNSKRGGSAKRKQQNIELAKEKAINLLKNPERELYIAIAMLYWSEGSKKVCEFINSDGKMIQVYLKILRDYLNISNDSIGITIRYFSGMDRDKCLKYWSKNTKISKRKFIIRFNDGGTGGRTKYGMCRVTIKRGHNILKLMHSLIDKISEQILETE
ncbi:MAG: hypothetical protein WC906_00625 [Parcubacteria group bacterium]|jgi:hypothetical protein